MTNGARRAAAFLVLTCTVALVAAQAQTWPTRPIRIIVAQAPGGVTDVVTRIIAQPLSEILGQAVVVEDRPGATGLVGTEVVARAVPDGYTLLSYVDANTILPFTMKHIDHDPDRSFAAITLVARGSHVIVANPSAPFSNLRELIDYAKAHPGDLSYASPGTGSPQHLATETLARETGIRITHIPYKGGGQAIVDVVAGNVPLGTVGLAPALPHLRAGKLKAIAVTGATRSPLLPDVATVAEVAVPRVLDRAMAGIDRAGGHAGAGHRAPSPGNGRGHEAPRRRREDQEPGARGGEQREPGRISADDPRRTQALARSRQIGRRAGRVSALAAAPFHRTGFRRRD
jgi:tripartite-type tricarboxylate transporter receptor subunit TctC